MPSFLRKALASGEGTAAVVKRTIEEDEQWDKCFDDQVRERDADLGTVVGRYYDAEVEDDKVAVQSDCSDNAARLAVDRAAAAGTAEDDSDVADEMIES